MTLVWNQHTSIFGIRHREYQKLAEEQLWLFSIKTRGLKQTMRELSGGKQQKVLLSLALVQSKYSYA